MGFRMGFDIWANTHRGEATLFRFSVHHSITSAQAFTTAFVLMAFAQVFFRVGILQYRRLRFERDAGDAAVTRVFPWNQHDARSTPAVAHV